MCGIVGFITSDDTKLGESKRSKFLRQALIVDTLRGDDSTGVFAVGHNPLFEDGSAYWLKDVVPGQEFVQLKDYWDNLWDVHEYRCVVGHNRAATSGKVVADNAHPFQEGPITLVHNGTLTSTHGLPMPLAGLKGVSVDSHAIAHNLANHPVSEVISELHGAFALVWHDARDDSINVVRNDDRPLHFGMGQDGKTLFFMSEAEMLHMVSTRLYLGIETIYYPHQGQYLKWLKDTPLDNPEAVELDLHVPFYYPTKSYTPMRYAGHHYGGYGYGGYDDDVIDWNEEYKAVNSNFPKAAALRAQDDYAVLGGRRRELPEIVLEGLRAHDLAPKDRIRFTPNLIGRNPHDATRGYAVGVVSTKVGSVNAVVYSCPPHQGTGAPWTVRPVGVKLSEEGDPWIICKYVVGFVNGEVKR